jgi:geranylgeranyl reductase family protein
MDSESYDVVVVGAGPAGSTAARVIAESGFSCLILERRRTVGVPIQCGEFLPIPREMISLFPNSPRARKLVNVPNELIKNNCHTLSLVSPRGKKYSFGMEFNVIARDLFDLHLVNQATRNGAELILQAHVLGLHRRDTVVFRHNGAIRKVKGKVIVGADGPSSTIAKSVGASYRDFDRDMSYSLQYAMEGIKCNPSICSMFFGSRVAPGGYTWIIPKSSSAANVGFGIRKKFGKSLNLRSMLDRFVRTNPNLVDGTILRRVGAQIPVGGPKETVHNDNLILVGDAAGHVMSTNGGGIPTALVGGEIAGETVAGYLESRISLTDYERKWKEEIGNELYSSLTMLRIADFVMRSDSLTEVGMRLAGSRFLEDVIRCRYPRPLVHWGRAAQYFLTKI